jgi:hypothetical protein
MPDIPITDVAHATADLKISDTSSFALAKLSTLNFASLPVVGDFQKPVDQSTIEHASFGMRLGSPAVLAGDAFATGLAGAVTGTLAIRKASSGGLFDDDGFSPELPIEPGTCWIGLDLQLDITAKAGAAFQGFGVEVEGDAVAAAGTLLRLDSVSGSLPKLAEALKAALEHYSIPRTVEEIRKQPLGTAHTAEVGGTVTFSGSYSVPINANALASASLPFNYKIALNPEATLAIGGSLALSGDFVVRTYKTSETQLTLGLYKKKGTTIEVEFTAAAGVAANAGTSTTDLVAAVLGRIFPKIDPSVAGFTGEQAEALDGALHACIDNSIATSINGSCAASKTDESAVVYSIDLSAGDQAATDKAITSALHGDWTLLENLQNAHPVRNVVRDVRTKGRKIVINLLGFYNAISVSEYVKSCQVLRDPDGQVVLVDKTKASQLRAAGAPKMADAERLRAALGEGFLTTATYAAAAGGKLALTNFTVQQTYARYAAKMPADEVRRQVRLGRALKLIGADGGWDAKLAGSGTFAHARSTVAASYDTPGALRLFFANPGAQTGFQRAQLEKTGRDSKIALLDPSETNAGARIAVLKDDKLWVAMGETGNVNAFKTIEGLRGLNDTALGAVSADWVDIRWWANAMLKVAPQLSQTLHAIELSTAPDPTTDAAFMKQRKGLEDILADVGKNTRSAFGDGWGLLVMFNLSNGAAALEMDLGWNGTLEHYVSGAKVATALGGS